MTGTNANRNTPDGILFAIYTLEKPAGRLPRARHWDLEATTTSRTQAMAHARQIARLPHIAEVHVKALQTQTGATEGAATTVLEATHVYRCGRGDWLCRALWWMFGALGLGVPLLMAVL